MSPSNAEKLLNKDKQVSLDRTTYDSDRATTMRQKRAKAYRKLMNLYSISFGFRQPYQVLGSVMSLSLGADQPILTSNHLQLIQKYANRPLRKNLIYTNSSILFFKERSNQVGLSHAKKESYPFDYSNGKAVLQ